MFLNPVRDSYILMPYESAIFDDIVEVTIDRTMAPFSGSVPALL